MTFCENLVTENQQNYSKSYSLYAQVGSPYKMIAKPKPSMERQIRQMARVIRKGDCIVAGGTSGLPAAA